MIKCVFCLNTHWLMIKSCSLYHIPVTPSILKMWSIKIACNMPNSQNQHQAQLYSFTVECQWFHLVIMWWTKVWLSAVVTLGDPLTQKYTHLGGQEKITIWNIYILNMCVSFVPSKHQTDLNHWVEYYRTYTQKIYVIQVWPHSSHEDLKQENVNTTISWAHMVKGISTAKFLNNWFYFFLPSFFFKSVLF